MVRSRRPVHTRRRAQRVLHPGTGVRVAPRASSDRIQRHSMQFQSSLFTGESLWSSCTTHYTISLLGITTTRTTILCYILFGTCRTTLGAITRIHWPPFLTNAPAMRWTLSSPDYITGHYRMHSLVKLANDVHSNSSNQRLLGLWMMLWRDLTSNGTGCLKNVISTRTLTLAGCVLQLGQSNNNNDDHGLVTKESHIIIILVIWKER